jgi:WD40 repeat protein
MHRFVLFTYAHACTQAATSRHATLEGHQLWVLCVATSGDGTIIVSGGYDGTLKVWGKDKRVCNFTVTKAHGGQAVTVIDIRGDGTVLVSGGGDGSTKVWGLVHGQAPTEQRTLTGHTDWVHCVKISPDGTKIASCSRDRTVRIWSVQTGEELQTLRGHEGWVRCVAWSPDSRLVASGGDDKTVRVWDVVGGTQATQPLRGHSWVVRGVAWGSRNASLLVSSGEDRTIIVWHLEGESATVMRTLRVHTGIVRSVSLSPDDRFIISGSDNMTVCVWEVATGQQVRVLEGHTRAVNSVACSRDGKCIVSGSDDSTVRMWEVDEQVCARVWLHVRACSCMYMCAYIHIYIYIYLSRTYICIFIYVYMIYMYTHKCVWYIWIRMCTGHGGTCARMQQRISNSGVLALCYIRMRPRVI